MNGKDFIHQISSIDMPDMERIRKNCLAGLSEAKKSQKITAKRLVAVGLCAIIVLAIFPVGMMFINLNGNGVTLSDTGEIYDEHGNILNLKGLPAVDFIVQDDPYGDRLGVRNLPELIYQPGSYSINSNFGVIRVTTVNEYGKDSTKNQPIYLIQADVILDIENKLDENIEIIQYYRGACPGETNQILRQEGIYIVPLTDITEGENAGRHGVWGSLDVLFEVDDKGLIHSHSGYYDFKRFDGKPYQDLLAEIKTIKSDIAFSVVNQLWKIPVLYKMTVLDEPQESIDKNSIPVLQYRVFVELFNENAKVVDYEMALGLRDFYMLKDAPLLKKGAVYITGDILYGYDNVGMSGNRTLIIKNGNILVPLVKDSDFWVLNIKTVNELYDAIDRLNKYYDWEREMFY
jgi:hypothetical protein